MITYKLKTPTVVGDMKSRITIDELVIVSISMTFLSDRPVISLVFMHPQSGHQLNVCYAYWNGHSSPDPQQRAGAKNEQQKILDASDKLWAHQDNLKPVLDEIVQLMVANGDLPALEKQ